MTTFDEELRSAEHKTRQAFEALVKYLDRPDSRPPDIKLQRRLLVKPQDPILKVQRAFPAICRSLGKASAHRAASDLLFFLHIKDLLVAFGQFPEQCPRDMCKRGGTSEGATAVHPHWPQRPILAPTGATVKIARAGLVSSIILQTFSPAPLAPRRNRSFPLELPRRS